MKTKHSEGPLHCCVWLETESFKTSSCLRIRNDSWWLRKLSSDHIYMFRITKDLTFTQLCCQKELEYPRRAFSERKIVISLWFVLFLQGNGVSSQALFQGSGMTLDSTWLLVGDSELGPGCRAARTLVLGIIRATVSDAWGAIRSSLSHAFSPWHPDLKSACISWMSNTFPYPDSDVVAQGSTSSGRVPGTTDLLCYLSASKCGSLKWLNPICYVWVPFGVTPPV